MADSSQNPSCYIKVEAVNIYNHIADTNQLSIIRGGGLLLKQAIDDISAKFSLKTITSGASQGVFSALDGNPAADISAWLNTHEHYKHFTFVVDAINAQSYVEAKEKLIALGRMRQMQQISQSPDYTQNEPIGPSAFGGVRVASTQIKLQNQLQNAATIDDVRAKFGKSERSNLYKRELSRAKKTAFLDSREPDITGAQFTVTHSFHALANNADMGNLHNKIAVIYCDGNGFSKIQNALVKSDRDQTEFDGLMQNYRSQFMYQLVSWYENAGHTSERFFYPNRDEGTDNIEYQARLETLLWGGDEMILVVPAWLGLDVLHLFYAVSADWNFRGTPLYHAGGIVFCHFKTPIFHIVDLARNLADNIKEHPNGRSNNYFDYVVLESVDYPTASLTDFFSQTYGRYAVQTRLFLPTFSCGQASQEHEVEYAEGNAILWANVKNSLKNMLPDLPRSQFYALIKTLRQELNNLEQAETAEFEARGKKTDASQDTESLTPLDNELIRRGINAFNTVFERGVTQFWRFSSEGLQEKFESTAEVLFSTAIDDTNTLPEAENETDKKNNRFFTTLTQDPQYLTIMTRFWWYMHMLELWDYLVPELREKEAKHA